MARVQVAAELAAGGRVSSGLLVPICGVGAHPDGKGGGVMVPASGVTEAEIVRFAAEDPAVKCGLLLAEVRPWLVGMSK